MQQCKEVFLCSEEELRTQQFFIDKDSKLLFKMNVCIPAKN